MLYLLFTERKNLKERDLELNQVNHAWMHCILENEHLYIKKKLIIILALFKDFFKFLYENSHSIN